MWKRAVLLIVIAALALPVYAQQSQQQSTTPIVVAPGLYNQAGADYQAQDYNQAVMDFSLFILLNPTFTPAYYGRAQSYTALNQLDQALQDVDQAISQSSSAPAQFNAQLYALRGGIEAQQQQTDGALKDLTQSITLQPDPQVLAIRGRLYLAKQDYQNALADFTQAISLDNSDAALYVYLGLANTDLKDQQAAANDYLHYLSMIVTKQQSANAIQNGQFITVQMSTGVVYQIPFTASAGQYVSAIAAPRSGQVDPLMVLIDAQGNPLAGDDDSGSNGAALIQDFHVPADGQYILLVGHSLGGDTGQVVVGLQLAATPTGQ